MLRFERLLDRLREHPREEAVIWKGQSYTFGDMEGMRLRWLNRLDAKGVKAGEVVGLQTDYSPEAISLFLALLSSRNIVALIPSSTSNEEILLTDGQAESIFRLGPDGSWEWEKRSWNANHPLIIGLKKSNSAGFIVFSSGSTGRYKAVLHDLEKFLEKFTSANKRLRTIPFLVFDHIGGVDTIFYNLWSRGVQILPERRDVKYICELIQRYRVEVLPTSPTFLRLLCLSHEYKNHDLSTLKVITYGAEPMSQEMLKRLGTILPNCRLVQKYGTSEFGSPKSKSRGNDSLWMTIENNECRIKVVENILWVRSQAAMLGYLNAPNPGSVDGWLCTGDEVSVDGEWIQFLGRKSEIIMVGGEKVYPTEIENVILQMEDVLDVAVRGEPHPLTGQIVCAAIQVKPGSKDQKTIITTIRKYCRGNLAPYKVPVRMTIVDKPLAYRRQKKFRTVPCF